MRIFEYYSSRTPTIIIVLNTIDIADIFLIQYTFEDNANN